MKYGLIIGTRPEIIKMSPVIRALEREEYFVVYSGQNHFTENKRFFEELRLPVPKYLLTSKVPINYDKFCYMLGRIMDDEHPDVVLVHGDTNTTLFGSIVASRCGIPVAHIEAGLRCYDSELPEEINRLAVDHLIKFLFVPSEDERLNLLKEGLVQEVYVVGNTVVDAVRQNIELAKSKIHKAPSEYFFLTLHRRENVDNPIQFRRIIESLLQVYNEYDIPFVFPVHPRARDMIEKYGLLDLFDNDIFMLIRPVGYLECLHYQLNALLIFSDSGGIQEESCVLKVPCITLRKNTERPATINVGSNTLVRPDQLDNLVAYVGEALRKKHEWDNPFGDGKTSERILQILREKMT